MSREVHVRFREGVGVRFPRATRLIAAFHYKRDAERFYEALEKRLLKFGLTVAVDKTRVLRFTRFRKAEGVRFEFLGFEFRWGTDRKGRDVIKRRTSRTRFRKSLKNLTEWCRESRCFRLEKLFSLLNSKLRGYYNYYGVIGNWGSLKEFYELVRRILYKWLNCRSQKRSFNYREFSAVLKRYRIEKPRITEKLHTKFTSCGLDLFRKRVSLKSPVR